MKKLITKTFFFQYNVPAHNHIYGVPDCFIDVLAKFMSYGNETTLEVTPIIRSNYDLICVSNWADAIKDMQAIAKEHFAENDVPADVQLQNHLG